MVRRSVKSSIWARMLAPAMVMVLIAGMFAGCGSGKSSADSTSAGTVTSASTVSQNSSNDSGKTGTRPGEKLKISYLRPVWGAATFTPGGDYEKALSEYANIEIDVQIIPVTEYDTKVKTTVAAGSLPDVMWAFGPSDPFWREMEGQGAFAKIDDYLNANPTVKSTVSDTVWGQMKNSDGSTYFLPRTIASVVPFFTYYRLDWFEAKGIAEPKTIDELNAALTKIKQEYPKVVPITVGTGGTEWMFKDLGTAFGCSVGSWVPDNTGKIVPSFGTKEQEDYFFWLQDLRRNGLLDPEVGVNPDVSHGKQKFMSGRAAAYPGGYPDFIEITSALKKSDPNAKVGIMSPLTGPTGIKGGTRTVYPVDRGLYFNAKSDKVKDFFTFLEWWLTEGTDFRRYGVEGKTYKVENGKKVSIPDAEREEAYKSTQIEPLCFIDLPAEQLDFENWRASFKGAGIEDQFDYWVNKFNEYMAVRYPDYLSPTVISQTNKEIGAQIWEGAMASAYGSVLLDTKADRKTYEAAYQKWLEQGGSKIIDEINAAQTDKSKPNY